MIFEVNYAIIFWLERNESSFSKLLNKNQVVLFYSHWLLWLYHAKWKLQTFLTLLYGTSQVLLNSLRLSIWSKTSGQFSKNSISWNYVMVALNSMISCNNPFSGITDLTQQGDMCVLSNNTVFIMDYKKLFILVRTYVYINI